MYELLGVQESVLYKYYDAVHHADKHPYATIIIPLAVKKAFHVLEPNFPICVAESYLAKILKPYFDRKRLGVYERPFDSIDEAKIIYNNQFVALLDNLEKDSSNEGKNMIHALDCIYDLLQYDRVVVIENQPYLYSWINLIYWGQEHQNAIEKRAILEKSKPAEKNIDTALNTNKAYKDRTKFISFDTELNNPFSQHEVPRMKQEILSWYPDEHRLLTRAIHSMSQLLDEYSNIPYIRAFGELEPQIDSDAIIPKKDIYESWYAHSVGIYKRSSKGTVPVKDALEIAKYLSFIIFPDISKQRNIVSLERAKRPIREKSFFKGLRLYEFTDNRLKITRPKDEIAFTEEYLTEVTRQLNILSKS